MDLNVRKRDLKETWLALLFLLLLILLAVSMLLGRFPQPGLQDPSVILQEGIHRNILLSIRLPRVLMSLVLGASLSLAGLVFQTILNNPMVEPGFLGVSQGASFGAALAILLLGADQTMIQILAIIFGIGGLYLSILLARYLDVGHWVMRLVLAGIAVSAFFSSGLGMLKYYADRLDKLPMLSFWLLGSTGRVTWQILLPILPPIAFASMIIILLRWRLNLLSLDDETALSISVNVKTERLIFLVCAVVITALCISACGLISWIGMIVPHMCRRIFGANTRFTVPASILLGAILMMICDNISRVLFPLEIPLGVVTAIIGAMLFIPIMNGLRRTIQ